MFDPIYPVKRKYVKNYTAVKKLYDIFIDGKLVYESPSIEEMNQLRIAGLDELWEENRRLLNPQIYPVDLSLQLWEDRQSLIEEIAERDIDE